MPERPVGLLRIGMWLGWGALCAIGYVLGVPLLIGGVAAFPIAVVAYESGLWEAAIVGAAGVFGVALMDARLSLPAIVLYTAGALLGRGLRPLAGARWLVAAVALSVAALVGFFGLPAYLGGYPVHLSPADARAIGQAFGLTRTQARQLTQQALALVPAFVPIYAAAIAAEAYALARWVLHTRGREITKISPFSLWQAPPWLAPIFLAALGAQTLFSLTHAAGLSQRWAGYALVWTQIPMAIFGLAVTSFLMSRLRVPGILRLGILVLMLLTPPFSQILIWVGVLDNMTDLRHIRGANT